MQNVTEFYNQTYYDTDGSPYNILENATFEREVNVSVPVGACE